MRSRWALLAAVLSSVMASALAQSQLWEWRASDGAAFAVQPGELWGLHVTAAGSDGVVATRRAAAAGSWACGLSAFPDAPASPPVGASWPATGYRCYRLAQGGQGRPGGVNWDSASEVASVLVWCSFAGLAFFGYSLGVRS